MTVRVVAHPDLPAIMVVVRSLRGDGKVLVVINPTEPAATIRGLGRVLLDREERSQLGRFLASN